MQQDVNTTSMEADITQVDLVRCTMLDETKTLISFCKHASEEGNAEQETSAPSLPVQRYKKGVYNCKRAKL